MSFGTFSTSLQGVYSWGVLRTAKFAGMVMDIDRIGATLVDKDNKQSNLLAFTQQQGPRQSLNENFVPEQFFNNSNNIQKNVEGISAIKALKLANDQGQKIYQIDQSNVNTILPQLNHDSQAISDIRNAVAAGKVVTTSEKSINFNGWVGSGYIITDPNTGSGAYMISGGLNGGWVSGIDTSGYGAYAGALLALLSLITAYPAVFGILTTAWFLGPLAYFILIISLIMVYFTYMDWRESPCFPLKYDDEFFTGLAIIISFIGASKIGSISLFGTYNGVWLNFGISQQCG